jgi:hypothetical protein
MTESLSKALRRPSVERSTSVLLGCGLLAGPLSSVWLSARCCCGTDST